jgi:hypothetical protein
MYDISGIKGEDVEEFIKDDILHLVRKVSNGILERYSPRGSRQTS